MASTQPSHPTLLIPGPIEFADDVLEAMGHFSESHVGAGFVKTFSETLPMVRQVVGSSASSGSQPIVLSGSGTLGWDVVAANLASRGDAALVLHTGYFGDSFAACLEAYGVRTTQLKAPIGQRPSAEDLEAALRAAPYKLVTVTHVDTSTGVLSDVRAVAAAVRKAQPDALVVVDGVCSVGVEELAFDEWGIDVVLTASQKGLGAPAGLSVLVLSKRALAVFDARDEPPPAYFASLLNWLPIMRNYEAGKPSYFATPSPQLVHALHTSLTTILARPLADRVADHRAVARKVQDRVDELGLKHLAPTPDQRANGMTAFYLPHGIKPTDVLPKLLERGVVLAGGLHKDIATTYLRFGHMGVSATDPARSKDVDHALNALSEALVECGYKAPQK